MYFITILSLPNMHLYNFMKYILNYCELYFVKIYFDLSPISFDVNGFHRKIFSGKSFSLKMFSGENILWRLAQVRKITKCIYIQ
jgi:hypothetical protein